MLKRLFLLLVLATCAACSDSDETPAPKSGLYRGSLTVTSNASPEARPFELPSARFEITADEEGSSTLTMHEIRFAASMPMSLTIQIPQLRTAKSGDRTSFVSSVQPIVPYIGGRPYSAFEIDDFTARSEGGRLEVEFTCRNPQIPVDDEPLDHHAKFSGKLDK